MTSDEALMLEFQGGSRAAFEELFARYREPLYGFFGRRLNNPERAEDLAQETFRWALRSSSDVLRSTDRQILLGGGSARLAGHAESAVSGRSGAHHRVRDSGWQMVGWNGCTGYVGMSQ